MRRTPPTSVPPPSANRLPEILFIPAFILGVVLSGFERPTYAQGPQTTVAVQSHRVSEGFFEYSGTSWTLIGPGGFARFGPPGPVRPPFATFGDGAGVGLGAYWESGPVQGQFFGQWSHGVQRSFVGQTLQITLPNGSWGSVGDQALTPFVIGFVPVVGMGWDGSVSGEVADRVVPWPSSPLPFAIRPSQSARPQNDVLQHSKTDPSDAGAVQPPDLPAGPPRSSREEPPLVLSSQASATLSVDNRGGNLGDTASTAERVVLSVEEARRLRQEELRRDNELAAQYVRQAEAALAAGKPAVAALHLRLALHRASGPLRDEILRKLATLSAPKDQPSAAQPE